MINLVNSSAGSALAVFPSEVRWSYVAFCGIFFIGLIAIFFRGAWQKSGGFDRLILLGPIFYAAPLAGFGTEHFTLTSTIASIVPPWMPWHLFWAYFVGACFIAAPLSMVTGIQARLSASLLAFTFFFFVMLMDVPALVQDPRNRIVWALSLRELSFSSGALALASGLGEPPKERVWRTLATIPRVAWFPLCTSSRESHCSSARSPAQQHCGSHWPCFSWSSQSMFRSESWNARPS